MLSLILGSMVLGAGDLEVTFKGAQGLDLHGTFTTPGTQKAPAVLLLPGSGPTDRNGNQPPLLVVDTLRHVAEGLAERGYATLRFDKRSAHAHSATWPKELAAMNAFFAWDRFVGDAAAAYSFLAARPEVDPSKVCVLGHSEGGLIAIELARKAKPAALVLVGTAGRALSAVVREQIQTALEAQKATDEQSRFYLDRIDLLCEEFVRDGKATAEIPPGLAALFPASAASYLQTVLALDPIALARGLDGPVLVVNGQKDVQVSAERDARPLHQALSERQGKVTSLVILEGASHNLKAVDPTNPAGLLGPVVPEAVPAIADWLDANCGAATVLRALHDER